MKAIHNAAFLIELAASNIGVKADAPARRPIERNEIERRSAAYAEQVNSSSSIFLPLHPPFTTLPGGAR